ncbi:hypothetical protein ACFYWN_43475 [Streptomyces sp. NPDC002917]
MWPLLLAPVVALDLYEIRRGTTWRESPAGYEPAGHQLPSY